MPDTTFGFLKAIEDAQRAALVGKGYSPEAAARFVGSGNFYPVFGAQAPATGGAVNAAATPGSGLSAEQQIADLIARGYSPEAARNFVAAGQYGTIIGASAFGGGGGATGLTPTNDQLLGSALFGDGGTGIDTAFGFPLLAQTADLILRANQERRAGIDQSLSLAQYLLELERVSPTRAADFATQFGLESPTDFSFVNRFIGGGPFPQARGGTVGGVVGGQQVRIPGTLSGRQLSFLDSNANVARLFQDVAERFGLPDIFQQSASAAIPTSGSLLQLAA